MNQKTWNTRMDVLASNSLLARTSIPEKKNNKLRKLETSLTSNSFSAEPGTAVLLTYLKLVKQQMDHTTVVVGVA